MKFTCERDKILSAFQTAATVAPSRSPKPILQNVKLVVTEQNATLSATDMEVGIRIDVPGIEVEMTGEALFPVGRFVDPIDRGLRTRRYVVLRPLLRHLQQPLEICLVAVLVVDDQFFLIDFRWS